MKQVSGLSRRQLRAALEVAKDEQSDESIAALLGIGRVTLYRWKLLPAFQSQVEEHRAAWREAIKAEGIAQKQNRVNAQNDRWLRMQTVIDERAESPEMQDVPGGKTGLLVQTIKQIGAGRDAQIVTQYEVDIGLLAEMRATEKQAAQELEQWNEKPGAVRDDRLTVEIVHIQTSDRGTSAAPRAIAGEWREPAVQRPVLREALGEIDAGDRPAD